jgi:hypothetical protein
MSKKSEHKRGQKAGAKTNKKNWIDRAFSPGYNPRSKDRDSFNKGYKSGRK